jgi:hypothetical protein
MSEVRFGVIHTGGSIGENPHIPLRDTFADKKEAKAKAMRMNALLSAGEKKYYKIRYKVIEVTY